jgi:uncharacterized protein YjbI with pentapeptide repeats
MICSGEQRLEDQRNERAEAVEEDRIEREIRQDNVRFIREVAIQLDAPTKPFAGFDLQDAQLVGLDLTADLANADLRGARTSASRTSARRTLVSRTSAR